MPESIEERWLPVKLTEQETVEKARELAHLEQEFDNVQSEKKTSMQGFKDRLDSISGTIKRTAKAVRDGEEFRNVTCSWEFNYQTNTATSRRIDTGESVLERAITAAERQIHLDGVLAVDEGVHAHFARLDETVQGDPDVCVDCGQLESHEIHIPEFQKSDPDFHEVDE